MVKYIEPSLQILNLITGIKIQIPLKRVIWKKGEWQYKTQFLSIYFLYEV